MNKKKKLVKTVCEECDGDGYVTARAYPKFPSKVLKIKCHTCHGRGWVFEESASS